MSLDLKYDKILTDSLGKLVDGDGMKKGIQIARDIFAPTVAHRFVATFFIKGIPSPLDMQFQSISGLSRELNVESFRQGGDNVGNIHLPLGVSNPNLVLERGVMMVTPVMGVFDRTLSTFNANYMTIVVMLLSDHFLPVCSWTLSNALPVKWSTDGFDANSNKILVNTLELSYEKLTWMGVKA